MQSFQMLEQSTAATTTNPNLLSGQPIQYWGKAGILTLYGNADAVGMTMSLSLNDGQTNIAVIPANSGLGVASTVGKIKTNEDFIGQYPVPAGVQLMLALTNTTGAAVKSSFLFVIT